MLKVIILLFSLAVIVAVVLTIRKNNGRKKWLTIIVGVLVFAIGSIFMSEFPPEKFLRTFSSPQEVFNYSQQGEIVKVIEGEKSAMVLYTDEGEKGQCLIAKGKNGWQLETLSTFKTVYFKKLENTKCTIMIFRIKGTDDYYVNVNSNFLDNEIKVSDSRNSDFFCIETPAPGTEMCAYTFYTYVPRIQDGYEIKINEEVFHISLTK
ncbi:MAG: hypothetical protein Q4C99_10915 [Clostridia bacterium]|nr:hypothetical protein [Clostridia bacterium]